ncbi:methyltransferase domain-containing protein [Streptomyces sp. NPDC048606]|uniref:methyltransferase domain-containing protein n=1 Tax=Streptomyces sp. NPDC048606 TaxID=3154726 RepID=UPI00342B9F40
MDEAGFGPAEEEVGMPSPEALARLLVDRGVLPNVWERAVRTVPRELFIPDRIEIGDVILSRTANPDGWLSAVYDDVPITTQVNDGKPVPGGAYRLPTSSSSMPTVMLEMLSLLDVRPGDRVLEAGTGTGYNAAWLSHRLGAEHVVSVDIDPSLVKQAGRSLVAAGFSPHLVVGDAGLGLPGWAPYDRVIGTYTVSEVPYAWVEQAPGGRIVVPWGGSFFAHSYAALDVIDGRAHGRFSGRPAFMRDRVARPHRGYLRDFYRRETGTGGRTVISPRALVSDLDALFFVGLALPDAWYLLAEADDGSGEATLWILADDRKSWATVEYEPEVSDYAVDQYGPRGLWDEIETAHAWWMSLGSPVRDRAGLTVDRTGQHLWLDEPPNTLTPPARGKS